LGFIFVAVIAGSALYYSLYRSTPESSPNTADSVIVTQDIGTAGPQRISINDLKIGVRADDLIVVSLSYYPATISYPYDTGVIKFKGEVMVSGYVYNDSLYSFCLKLDYESLKKIPIIQELGEKNEICFPYTENDEHRELQFLSESIYPKYIPLGLAMFIIDDLVIPNVPKDGGGIPSANLIRVVSVKPY